MDQPPQQPPLNPEGIIASILGAAATLGAIVVRGRFRIKGMQAKVEAESVPTLQKENIAWAEQLISQFKAEADLVRQQARAELERCSAALDKERLEKFDYMKQTMELAALSRQQAKEIEELNERVTELEKQVAEARNHRGDVR